jgi:hypothetical protein
MDRFKHFALQFADYPALLQKNLTIEGDDKKRAPPPRPAPNRSATDSRGQHRPSRSDEEERRMRDGPRGPPRPRGPPGSRPPRPSSRDRRDRDRDHRRPRRNSESSIIDRGSLDADEERRRRQRRREREERAAKDGKSSSQRKVRRPQGLDLIDKLDVTGIYGPSLIHHDGPYDAVQPHRNRKKDVRAPMEAFPLNSANNSLGGSGPLNQKIDLDRIHGRGAEGFTDFAVAETTEWKKPRVEAEFNAKARDVIHGEQSHGLGTSTFLEGAPASRKAVEEDIQVQRAMADSGLGRKKSIAQRFRGISQPRRQYGDGPRITSPEARYGNVTSPNATNGGPHSAGVLGQTKATETNPFFDEYNNAYDSKGAAIKATERDGNSPPGRNALQRSVTSDSMGSPTNEPKASGGFLNRVKSLKGGRRRPA